MKKNIIFYSLVFIIFIQCLYIFIVFAFFKEGYHSDEVYNYGFANSYYFKDLDDSFFEDSIFQKWSDPQLFKDYISVDKEHRFAYDAVLKNCNIDFNPPFQFMVLHTICSFFPGVFSWYFCFVINIFSFVVTQFFIFKLSKSITKSNITGLCSVILYGFCVGAMDITVFMRIYGMGTMFIVLFMYYSHNIYNNYCRINKALAINFLYCFIFLFFGAYTMHIFLIPAFFITLSYCLYYLFSKHIKLFFSYGFTCLGAVALSCVLYPKTFENLGISISHSGVSSSEVSYSLIKYPLPMQLRLYAYQFTRDLFGIHIDPWPNPYFEYFLIGLFCFVVLTIPFCFVFRKEKWFINAINKTKNRFLFVFKRIKLFNISIIVLLFSFLSVWFFVAWKTSWYLMKVCANRYLFVAYPLAAVFSVVIGYYIFSFLFNKKISLIIIIILSCSFSFLSHCESQSHAFLFEHYKNGITFDDLEDDSNNVLMLSSPWTIVFFAPKLYKTNSFFATDITTYKNNKYFEEIDYNHPYYVILDRTYFLNRELDENNPDDKNMLDIYGESAKLFTMESVVVSFYESDENVDYLEYVGTDEIMHRVYHIYKVHFN